MTKHNYWMEVCIWSSLHVQTEPVKVVQSTPLIKLDDDKRSIKIYIILYDIIMYTQLQIKVNQLYVGSIKSVVQFMQMHGIQSGHKKAIRA